MELIKCGAAHVEALKALYGDVVRHLEATVNYPKWSSEHPSEQGIADAVRSGTQYLCTENGAVVLNDNPEGAYDGGDWSVPLRQGEYMVIHALAVHPDHARQGVGDFMVEQCIALARQKGFRVLRLDVVPGNVPAARLYEKHGVCCVGTKDLLRGIREIPMFDLFERTI